MSERKAMSAARITDEALALWRQMREIEDSGVLRRRHKKYGEITAVLHSNPLWGTVDKLVCAAEVQRKLAALPEAPTYAKYLALREQLSALLGPCPTRRWIGDFDAWRPTLDDALDAALEKKGI
jgi:hypothetical protein